MLDNEMKANTLLLLWLAWFLRNDIMHGDGLATVLGSAEFLRSYSILLSDIGHTTGGGSDKGKSKVQEGGRSWGNINDTPGVTPKWTVPLEGWVKLNTDARYQPDTGEASTGVVVRDSQGNVL
jgi:hypothetical protein